MHTGCHGAPYQFHVMHVRMIVEVLWGSGETFRAHAKQEETKNKNSPAPPGAKCCQAFKVFTQPLEHS